MELDLRHLFAYARRWWWLLLLLPLLAGGTAYVFSSRQQPVYSATATLLIQPRAQSDQDPLNAIRSGQSLAATYQQLVVTAPVLSPVIQSLSLPFTVDQLERKVSASTTRDTNLLRVSVSDTSPERAATIANAVAQQFAAFITAGDVANSTTLRDALQGMVDSNQQEVTEVNQRIDELESAGSLTPDQQSELAGLRTRKSQLEGSLSNLFVQIQQMDLNAAAMGDQVTLKVPATVPDSPYAPRVFFYTVLAVFFGILIAAGAVALLEYLDNTVKASLEFAPLIGAPLLSVIGAVPKLGGGHDQLFVTNSTRSTAAEAIRLLRANLEFAAAAKELRSIAVTSPGPGDGKSTVTANLGVAMAQAGFSVVIIDTDLRRPSQHRIFDHPNDRGLTTYLTRPDLLWPAAATPVATPNLLLIPSGPIPPNPADLLSLERFRSLIQQLTQEVDVVLLDTPPALVVSDPLVIASHVDGMVLVCHAGKTRIETLKRTAHLFQQGGIRLVGLVLNRQRGRGSDAYYGYYYQDYYGPSEPDPKPPTPTRAKVGFGRRMKDSTTAAR